MKTVNIIPGYYDHIPRYNLMERQTPSGEAVWQDWKFIFNAHDQHYDYLVVFSDLPAPISPSCPPENTIHVATEPPEIACHDDAFLAQFGSIITQDIKARHPRKIFSHGGICWFIEANISDRGDTANMASFRNLEKLFDQPKTKLMSVISSAKATRDGHARRLRFVQKLKKHFGEQLDVYGRGINPIKDKSQALTGYRFHVALENSSIDHYFTEKITDSFIAGSYPMYYGCPNIGDYFPENSYLPIDIDDFAATVASIQEAIDCNYDREYREQLRQARDITMYEHNLYPLIVRIIDELKRGVHGAAPVTRLYHGQIMPGRHSIFNPATKQCAVALRKSWEVVTMRSLYVLLRKIYLRFACRKLRTGYNQATR